MFLEGCFQVTYVNIFIQCQKCSLIVELFTWIFLYDSLSFWIWNKFLLLFWCFWNIFFEFGKSFDTNATIIKSHLYDITTSRHDTFIRGIKHNILLVWEFFEWVFARTRPKTKIQKRLRKAQGAFFRVLYIYEYHRGCENQWWT